MGYALSKTHSTSFPTLAMAGGAMETYAASQAPATWADRTMGFLVYQDPLGFWTVDIVAEGLGVVGHLAGEFAEQNAAGA